MRMTALFRSLLAVIVFATPMAAIEGVQAQARADQPAKAQVTSRVTVTLPQSDADLIVEGTLVPGDGVSRTFDTPPLEPGTTYHYQFTAEWHPNTYTTMTRSKTVSFRAGEALTVDLSREEPGDRVRVIYVPTPQDVAEAMVALAGVKAGDVVYEPGCGDARITIAAIKAGATRGICVDIDPERVEESRAKVREAGLQDAIEVRLGDALDVQDLEDVTVVFLYMGDHFNLLVRPVL